MMMLVLLELTVTVGLLMMAIMTNDHGDNDHDFVDW
jgi:hypothetical protein